MYRERKKNKMSNMFTLISLYVRGIRERVKRKNIFEWCKMKGGDIVFFTRNI